jgi:hypothetical protein
MQFMFYCVWSVNEAFLQYNSGKSVTTKKKYLAMQFVIHELDRRNRPEDRKIMTIKCKNYTTIIQYC